MLGLARVFFLLLLGFLSTPTRGTDVAGSAPSPAPFTVSIGVKTQTGRLSLELSGLPVMDDLTTIQEATVFETTVADHVEAFFDEHTAEYQVAATRIDVMVQQVTPVVSEDDPEVVVAHVVTMDIGLSYLRDTQQAQTTSTNPGSTDLIVAPFAALADRQDFVTRLQQANTVFASVALGASEPTVTTIPENNNPSPAGSPTSTSAPTSGGTAAIIVAVRHWWGMAIGGAVTTCLMGQLLCI